MNRWPSFSFEQCLKGISWANLFMLMVSIPKTSTDKSEDANHHQHELNRQLEEAGF